MKPSCLEEITYNEGNERTLLCAHGLNQQPKALGPLLNDIGQWGCNTYLMHLPGHCGETSFSGLNSQTYLNAYGACYQYLRELMKHPIFFLGYSFGGLIGVQQYELCPLEKMILIAPALRLRSYTQGLQIFLPFVKRVFSVQFGNEEFEKYYRYHQRGVPTEIYSSFFTTYKSFRKNEGSQVKLKSSEALVFVHPGDELVSFKGLEKMTRSLEGWRFKELKITEASFKKYKHLCFDAHTLGLDSYGQMLSDIQGFLK